MRFVGYFLKGLGFLVAALYIVTIIIGQTGCPYMACKGTDGDAWMPAFFLTIYGLPCLIWAIVMIIKAIRRKMRKNRAQ